MHAAAASAASAASRSREEAGRQQGGSKDDISGANKAEEGSGAEGGDRGGGGGGGGRGGAGGGGGDGGGGARLAGGASHLFLPKLGEADVSAWRQHCTHCPYPGPPASAFEQRRLALHYLLEEPTYSPSARAWHAFVIFLILVSTVTFCLETLPSLRDSDAWFPLETAVVAVFSAEYVARILTSSSILSWVVEPLNVVDLLAVLPYYIELLWSDGGSGALRIFRAVRLARIFRLFKISRYSGYMRIMGQALRKSADAFGLLLFFLGIAVVISSSLMFHAEEGEHDGDAFESIPATAYFVIVTMTTVGYGDQVPVTNTGRFIASATMIAGILVIALPVTILGSNFAEVYMQHQANTRHRKQLSDTALGRRRGVTLARGGSSGGGGGGGGGSESDDEAAEEAAAEAAALELADHILAVRRHKVELDLTLRQARAILERHAGGAASFQVWSVIDDVVVRGLARVEELLEEVRVVAAPGAAAVPAPTHEI